VRGVAATSRLPNSPGPKKRGAQDGMPGRRRWRFRRARLDQNYNRAARCQKNETERSRKLEPAGSNAKAPAAGMAAESRSQVRNVEPTTRATVPTKRIWHPNKYRRLPSNAVQVLTLTRQQITADAWSGFIQSWCQSTAGPKKPDSSGLASSR